MNRPGLWVIACVLLFAALPLLYVAGVRLAPLPATTAEALSGLEATLEGPGPSAWHLLWLGNRDVPDGERIAAAEADAEAIRARGPLPGPAEGGEWPPLPSHDRYPVLPPVDRALPNCTDGRGCLDAIERDPAVIRTALSEQAPRLSVLRRIPEFAHTGAPFGHTAHSPLLPHSGNNSLLLGELGLRFVDGDPAALEDTCRLHAAWRSYARHPQNLIDSMLYQAFARGSARLLAEMLARTAPGQALPAACDDAMSLPDAADLDFCRAMAGEFQMVQRLTLIDTRTLPGKIQRLTTLPFFSQRLWRRWSAENMGWPCTASGRARLASDVALVRSEIQPPRRPVWQCAAAAIHCILADIASPAYTDYANRVLDHGAEQRLLATLAWLRPAIAAGEDPGLALARLPDGYRSPVRAPRIEHAVDEGREQAWLSVERYSRTSHHDGPFRLPLPAAAPPAVMTR